MKMIRNKNEVGSAKSLLIFLIGILVLGAALRSRSSAGGALTEFIPERFGTLLRPTIFVQELTQLAGFAYQWLRDFSRVTGFRSLTRSYVVLRDASTSSQGDAT